jgi:ABC-2 type transport system permease protein
VKALTIAGANVRRLLRDRIGLFFVFVFPIIIIITLGAAFGGGFTARLGVHSPGGGALEDGLVERLGRMPDVEVVRYDDPNSLRDAVERALVEAGLVIPDRYDDALASGSNADLDFLAPPGGFAAFSIRAKVELVAAEQGALVSAARAATGDVGGTFEQNLALAGQVAGRIPAVEVRSRFAQAGAVESTTGQFEQGAASQLILFMFVTSVSAAAQLILTRKLGVSRRMISTPTSVRTVLTGETLGRFGVAMVQGLFIVVASALVFDVRWGDPAGTGLVVVTFALVATGAAMLFGAVFENDQQASSIGIFVGLALAALGGCMVPLEEFPPVMATVAHFTPHAWAMEALTDLIQESASIGDILPDLAVLAGFAAVLLTAATWRLRRAIVG